MEIIKKILNAICDPFRKTVSHIDTDKVSKFFHRYKYILYLVSFILTLIVFVLVYTVSI